MFSSPTLRVLEMARVLLWLFTLLSLRISHLNALLTLETTVNIVSSLQQYYRAGCVALLYTKDDVNNISSLVLLEKSLSTKFIPTVTLDFSSFSVVSIDPSCCGNYPFYVLPWANKNTSRELEKWMNMSTPGKLKPVIMAQWMNMSTPGNRWGNSPFGEKYPRYQPGIGLRTPRLVARCTDHYITGPLSARFRLSGQLWSVFLDEQITIQEFFADVAIPFDCLLLAVEAHGSVIRLTEVYRIAPGLPLRTNHIGFKGSDGRMVYSPLSFYERRSDLHGITIQGSTYKESLVESQNKHLYAVNAFLGEIFSALQVRMNFNLNMTSPSQESITSLINKLSQGQLEIGLTLITLNQKNKDKVGVTVPVLHR
ncbi:unnamed protein product, partial [Timema podura]|nr:unnamed protein product [Timema podura]